MILYHFSDAILSEGDFIQPGGFKKFITKQSSVVQEFERVMEERRKILCPTKPSRLNCVFAFDQQYADGFKTDRKFLYEIETTSGSIISIHNYNVGTYFSDLFKYCPIDQILLDQDLMDCYWTSPTEYRNWEGDEILFDREYLISDPVKILRVIPLK